eukprot:5260180-Ditylum_brightwellii.AAC.1
MFVGTITDPKTGKQLDYQDLVQDTQYKAVWEKVFTKELDQLTQGTQKEDPNHVRLTVGGNRVEYPFDVSTPTADLNGAKFLTIDIKNFYLNTPMERYEYMRLQYEILPQEIVTTD